MRARRFVWVALVSMAACGDEETAETGSSAMTIDRLRGEAVGATCDFRVRCGWEPDVETCRRVEFADNELLQLIADEPRGLSHYDAAAARVWIEAVRAQRCAVHSTAADQQLEAARNAVFTGTVAEGGPCWVDGECQGDRVCDRSGCMDTVECCAGQCAAAPAKVGMGQPCDGSIPCVDGAYCSNDECVATADVGEPCSALAGCQDEQACDLDGSGTCYKLAAPGEKCEPSLGVACAEYDQFCTPEGACARRAAEGAPCDPDGQACLRYAACVDGVCTRRPSEGQPCSDVLSCLGDLVCADGACARPTILVCGG